MSIFNYIDYLMACDEAKNNENIVVVYDTKNWFYVCSYEDLNHITFGEYGYQWIVEKDGSRESFDNFINDFLFCEK